MPSAIRLCEEADLLRYEPRLEEVWPRLDRQGNLKNDWDVQISLATIEISDRLRHKRNDGDVFEIGRLSIRSKENVRKAATFFALHFMFMAAQVFGDESGFLRSKSVDYAKKAESALEAEALALDYDADGSGTIDDSEKQRPFPDRIRRG